MKKGVIALLACAFALSLALVGCGGDVKSAWVGTWDLYEMEENGQLTSSDAVELLKSYGIDVYLVLNEDGTGLLVSPDEDFDGEWEASSVTAGTFTAKGQTIDMSIADGKLIMEQGGTKFTFVAGEVHMEASASVSAALSASSTSDVDISSEKADGTVKSEDGLSDFVGTWNLVDAEKDSIRASDINPSALDSMREEYFLNIAEDGFIDIVLDGEVLQSVWEASSSTEAKVLSGASRDDTILMVLKDGELVFGPINGTTMYYEKGDPRETPPLPEGQPSLREVIGG